MLLIFFTASGWRGGTGTLIDGSTSVSLAAQWQSVLIYSDGTTWYVLAEFDGTV